MRSSSDKQNRPPEISRLFSPPPLRHTSPEPASSNRRSHDSEINKMATRQSLTVFAVELVLFLVSGSLAEFIVTHAPEHVKFLKDSEDLRLSEIQDVISTAFGFDIEKDLSWRGLAPGNLFLRPKAAVLITVESPRGLDLGIKGLRRYETTEDVPEVDTDDVAYNILNLAGKADRPVIVDLTLESRVLELRARHPELFGDVPKTASRLADMLAEGRASFNLAQIRRLNISRPADLNFIGELHVIKVIIRAVRDNGQQIQGRLPNFFHFNIHGIQNLIDEYGPRSEQVEDAKQILSRFIEEITADIRAVYADNVIVAVVTHPRAEMGTLSRKARHLLQEAGPTKAPPTVDLKLAAEYSDMYPVVFNIILWFVIVMAIAIYGISYGVWYMDPGRDSIIYRMTSQRIKKD